MSLIEVGARGSEATPSRLSPVGGQRLASTLGVETGYALTVEQAGDLFRLAAFLRHVLVANRMTSTGVKKRMRADGAQGWERLGSLLALTEARRPTLATLERFAVVTHAPPGSLDLLVAAVPHAIVLERDLGS